MAVDKMKKVMHEFKAGKLHSGSKTGKKVKDRKQAIAIGFSERRRYGQEDGGYKSHRTVKA